MNSHYPRSWLAVLPVGDRLSKVRIVYSDESEQGANERLVVVSAIMLNMESQWEKLESDFELLPEGWRNRREVKGSQLLRDLRVDRGPESESALKILCAIPAARGIPIFTGAVSSSALGSLSPYDVAFRICMDRVESYLETVVPWEKILWIADTGHESRMKTAFDMQRFYSLRSIAADFGLAPRQDFGLHLIDAIYFGDSHESRALQLADVCCSVITGHLLDDPIVKPYYEMIIPQLISQPVILGKRNG